MTSLHECVKSHIRRDGPGGPRQIDFCTISQRSYGRTIRRSGAISPRAAVGASSLSAVSKFIAREERGGLGALAGLPGGPIRGEGCVEAARSGHSCSTMVPAACTASEAGTFRPVNGGFRWGGTVRVRRGLRRRSPSCHGYEAASSLKAAEPAELIRRLRSAISRLPPTGSGCCRLIFI